MTETCNKCGVVFASDNGCPYCREFGEPDNYQHPEEPAVLLHKHEPWERTAVMCIETGEVYPSAKAACDAIGCGKSAMSNHLAGRYPHVRGKHFKRVTAVLSPEEK